MRDLRTVKRYETIYLGGKHTYLRKSQYFGSDQGPHKFMVMNSSETSQAAYVFLFPSPF